LVDRKRVVRGIDTGGIEAVGGIFGHVERSAVMRILRVLGPGRDVAAAAAHSLTARHDERDTERHDAMSARGGTDVRMRAVHASRLPGRLSLRKRAPNSPTRVRKPRIESEWKQVASCRQQKAIHAVLSSNDGWNEAVAVAMR